MSQVLFVDDDPDLHHAVQQSLSLAGYTVVGATGAALALREIANGFDGVVVTDIRMPGIDGLELLTRIKAHDPDMPVILVSGHADVPTAVGALKQGAYDVLEKPYAIAELVATVGRALELRRLVVENRRLRDAAPTAAASPLLGHAPAMEQVRRAIGQVAPIDVDVLIQGETGTGKGMVAGLLHALSRRRGQLVTVDCGALPGELVEAELFGHVAGAVPGNHMPRTGRIEQAHRGTLFLDDIDALDEAMQAKLQRALEYREVTPIGATAPRAVDLRVISASRADLETLSRAGGFRAALYYRLNGVTLRLPPLRERREDIALLFRTFVLRAAERLGSPAPSLDPRTFQHLERHEWSGNVRELIRFAENFVLGLGPVGGLVPVATTQGDLRSQVDRFETQLIEEALAAANGDATRACETLGLPRKTFYYKVHRLGIDLESFRA